MITIIITAIFGLYYANIAINGSGFDGLGAAIIVLWIVAPLMFLIGCTYIGWQGCSRISRLIYSISAGFLYMMLDYLIVDYEYFVKYGDEFKPTLVLFIIVSIVCYIITALFNKIHKIANKITRKNRRIQ